MKMVDGKFYYFRDWFVDISLLGNIALLSVIVGAGLALGWRLVARFLP